MGQLKFNLSFYEVSQISRCSSMSSKRQATLQPATRCLPNVMLLFEVSLLLSILSFLFPCYPTYSTLANCSANVSDFAAKQIKFLKINSLFLTPATKVPLFSKLPYSKSNEFLTNYQSLLQSNQ